MNASGFTINFLTLLAIAASLGTLIANAIVIIENVLVHLEHKETPAQAAIDGTKEVAGAVIAATGTNLVVFTPIAMMGGVVGTFMRSFGLTVVYATLFSLLASFTLTPMLCALLLKKRTNNQEAQKVNTFLKPFRWFVTSTNKIVEFLKKEYKYIFETMFRYPKITILFVILLFFSLKLIMPYIANDFMPHSDEDKIKVFVTMPQGSTIERTSVVVKSIEKRIKKIPEKESFLVSIGKNGVENAEITIDLKPSTQRKRSDADIIEELIPFIAKIPDAETELIRSGIGSGVMEGDVSINLYGLDYDTMIELSQEVKKTMIKTGYFRSVNSSYKVPKTEIQFIPNQEKLIEYGLTAAQVGSIVRASVYGDDSNVYKEKGEEYDINVELDDRYAETFDDVKEISVLSRKGLIPITELGVIKEAKTLPVIWHRDKDRVIRLEGYLSKGSLIFVKSLLDGELEKISFPQGYGYKYVGNSELQEESAQETVKAFSLAVILTFMLLCAILNSFKYPISILLTVVTSFIGVFYALFFFGQSINIASMLAMVMLVGLVVNNAILLLDYTLLKMKEGVPVKEALWLGASAKFRAIIMTSIAIMLGILPQLGAIMEAKKSMAVIMIGGMFASIVFTFIFVPVVFWYIEKLNIKLFTGKGESK
jgi:hydrophobic/amphiphilic exporter-1 (mainly G- bacteria), HAE1 family